jgi:hypothetical protein
MSNWVLASWAISLLDTLPNVLPASPALSLTTTVFLAICSENSFAFARFSAATFSSFAF